MFLTHAWLQWNISNTHANTFDIIRWLELVDDLFGTYTTQYTGFTQGFPNVFRIFPIFSANPFPAFPCRFPQMQQFSRGFPAVTKAPEVFPQIPLFSYIFLKVPKALPFFLMFSYIFLKNGKVFAWFCSTYCMCSSSFFRFPTISIKFPCF